MAGSQATAVVLTGALLSLAGAVDTATKPAQDWPLFRGNALQTGVAGSELPERLAVRWGANESGRLRAVVQEDEAGSSQAQRRRTLVFRRWDERASTG